MPGVLITENGQVPVNVSPTTYITWTGMNNAIYTLQTSNTTSASTLPVFSQQTTGLYWQQLCTQAEFKSFYFNMPTITSSTTTNLTVEYWARLNEIYEETAEQKRERLERQQEADRKYAEQRARQKAERDAANELANNLLLACLTPEQARQHLEEGFFDVVGSRGHRFRIQTARRPDGGTQSGNVILLNDEGKNEAKYCVHPPDGLPHPDAWLAQKLALEADEDRVLAVANMPWRREGHVDLRQEARERLRLAA